VDEMNRPLTNTELITEDILDHRLGDKNFQQWLAQYKESVGEVDDDVVIDNKTTAPTEDPMSLEALGKRFWKDYFGEDYWRNYGGIGEEYQEDIMEHMPSFAELTKVAPGGEEMLKGKSILSLGSAFGHELVHLQDNGMQPHGVEVSRYCIDRVLPSAKDLTTYGDADDFLASQPADSYDYILATCLEYLPDEATLVRALQHCRRVARHGMFVVCVQADMDDTVDNHVVALMKNHAWWEQQMRDAGFAGLSKEDFIQWAPCSG